MRRILLVRWSEYSYEELDTFRVGLGNRENIVIHMKNVNSFSKKFLKNQLVDNYSEFI